MLNLNLLLANKHTRIGIIAIIFKSDPIVPILKAPKGKHKKYSDLPKILEKKESEEQKELNGLIEYLSRFNNNK